MSQFRQTTASELAVLATAPAWTREYTGDCTHQEMADYPDGTVECTRCGICPPADGNWPR
jgi:hypothetical protein